MLADGWAITFGARGGIVLCMKMTGVLVGLGMVALSGVGCKKTADNTVNYRAAINAYYAARPACLWVDPVKFPVQADTSDRTKTAPYDALVDQGLLVRTTAEKKELLVISKQVTNYDLSDKGRSAWTPNVQQPGFGNFCYGARTVSSIESATPANDQAGATTTVNYHAGISTAPGWATAAETENAFPQVRTDLGAEPGVATLTNTANGWVVTNGPLPVGRGGATNADGSIVQ